MPSALSVVALAERGTMFDPGPCVYMEKIAGGADIADLLDLDRPLGETLKLVAKRRGSDVSDLMVIMLDRERHARCDRARSASAAHASASSPTATSRRRCWRSRAAPASTCCGASAARPRACSRRRRSSAWAGDLIGRLWPRDDDERSRAMDAGYDLDEMLDVDRLVAGDDVFFAATGVTDGDLLQGVRYGDGAEATTESLVMRSRSGTVRKV